MARKAKINKFLNRLHLPHWLTILLAIVLLLRIPSFFEPFSYGDEMIYLALGEGIRQGLVLYRDIHDNKPPLIYLLAAVAGNVFWFKVILAFWHLATTVIFWKLAQVLFPKRQRLQKVATSIFAISTSIPLLEGNIVNSELLMIGPIMLAFYLLLGKPLVPKNLFKAGLLFSIASLFKIPAAFDLPTIIVFWLITGSLKTKDFKKVFKDSLYLILGFLLPILATFFWYYLRGGLREYLVAAYLQNVGYLSSFRPGDVQKPFLVRNLPLLTRAGIVALATLAVAFYRRRLSKPFIFLTVWLLFTLFAVTLSERPYPHYLVQSAAPVSFLLAIFFTQKTLEQTLVILPLGLAFFVPLYYRFWYYSTTPYYLRFIKLATGRIDKQTYLKSFGDHVPRAYQIADFITESTRRDERIFVWGDDSQLIYALSRRLPPIRYVAQYHINDFSSQDEVFEALKKQKPKLVIILPKAPSFPRLTMYLRENYILVNTLDGAQIWSLISPKVRGIIAP